MKFFKFFIKKKQKPTRGPNRPKNLDVGSVLDLCSKHQVSYFKNSEVEIQFSPTKTSRNLSEQEKHTLSYLTEQNELLTTDPYEYEQKQN